METTKEYLKKFNEKQEQKKKELLKPNPEAKPINKKELLNNLNKTNSNKKEVINFSVKIDKDLKEQFYFIAKNSNIKNKDLINNIFSEYFKKRTLTSDFLKLDNPYYFNVVELLEQKETKAISKAPETNQFNYYIINAIPINFNTWNKNYNSYCFNNEFNHHKGIIFNCFVVNDKLYNAFIIFELKDKDLIIKLYDYNELNLLINNDTKEIINELKNNYKVYYEYSINNLNLNFINNVAGIKINKPIDNISNSNYNIFKPYYLVIAFNHIANELKEKEYINICGLRFYLEDLEGILNNRYYNDIFKNDFYNYCKEYIFK